MSCPQPKTPPPEEGVTTSAHPAQPCRGEEELADRLHAEQEAHEATRQALVAAMRERDALRAEVVRLRHVDMLARALAAVTTVPVHTPEQEAALEQQLADGLLGLSFHYAQEPKAPEGEVAHG